MKTKQRRRRLYLTGYSLTPQKRIENSAVLCEDSRILAIGGASAFNMDAELEVYDLLIKGKKLTKAEEQKVKLAAKNLYKKLTEEKATLMVVDWYKDDQPTERVKNAIKESLNIDLPECYDKDSFNAKTVLLLNHFIDMAVQGYGWVGASA